MKAAVWEPQGWEACEENECVWEIELGTAAAFVVAGPDGFYRPKALGSNGERVEGEPHTTLAAAKLTAEGVARRLFLRTV